MNYNIADSLLPPVTGSAGDFVPKSVDKFAQKWVGEHYLFAFALLIVGAIIIVALIARRYAESFNPTATLRMTQRDGLGENLDATSTGRGASAFAQTVQSGGDKSMTIDAAAAAGQPGSLAYQVLHSADFNCNNRTSIGNDAWAWMDTQARAEGFAGDRPKTDNDFSKVLSGHA